MKTQTHEEQRKDPRWQKKRLEVFDAADWRCEDCGARDRTLDVHHTAYISRRPVWDYPYDLLMCLCRDCHEHRQSREDAFRVAIGEMTRCLKPDELENEVWRILDEIRAANAARKAEAFS